MTNISKSAISVTEYNRNKIIETLKHIDKAKKTLQSLEKEIKEQMRRQEK